MPEKDYGKLVTGDTTMVFASIELGNTNFRKGFEKIENDEKR